MSLNGTTPRWSAINEPSRNRTGYLLVKCSFISEWQNLNQNALLYPVPTVVCRPVWPCDNLRYNSAYCCSDYLAVVLPFKPKKHSLTYYPVFFATLKTLVVDVTHSDWLKNMKPGSEVRRAIWIFMNSEYNNWLLASARALTVSLHTVACNGIMNVELIYVFLWILRSLICLMWYLRYFQ